MLHEKTRETIETSTTKPTNGPGIDRRQRHSAWADMPSGLVHLYRAEVGRAVSWRSRLDVTTNWAVATTAAGMTFALGDVEPARHVVILLTSVMVTFFLLFEARRFRYYHLLQSRVQLLEGEVYAPWIDSEHYSIDEDWEQRLATDLRYPRYQLSFLEAVGARLWRNYLWLYMTHLLIWLVKIAIHPEPVTNVGQLIHRAGVGPIPGTAMVVIGVLFNTALVVTTVVTIRRVKKQSDITQY